MIDTILCIKINKPTTAAEEVIRVFLY